MLTGMLVSACDCSDDDDDDDDDDGGGGDDDDDDECGCSDADESAGVSV